MVVTLDGHLPPEKEEEERICTAIRRFTGENWIILGTRYSGRAVLLMEWFLARARASPAKEVKVGWLGLGVVE